MIERTSNYTISIAELPLVENIRLNNLTIDSQQTSNRILPDSDHIAPCSYFFLATLPLLVSENINNHLITTTTRSDRSAIEFVSCVCKYEKITIRTV